jgi:hypothetical protein
VLDISRNSLLFGCCVRSITYSADVAYVYERLCDNAVRDCTAAVEVTFKDSYQGLRLRQRSREDSEVGVDYTLIGKKAVTGNVRFVWTR